MSSSGRGSMSRKELFFYSYTCYILYIYLGLRVS